MPKNIILLLLLLFFFYFVIDFYFILIRFLYKKYSLRNAACSFSHIPRHAYSIIDIVLGYVPQGVKYKCICLFREYRTFRYVMLPCIFRKNEIYDVNVPFRKLNIYLMINNLFFCLKTFGSTKYWYIVINFVKWNLKIVIM